MPSWTSHGLCTPLSVLVLFVSLGCADNAREHEWAFHTVAQGSASARADEYRETIRDAAAWTAFWTSHTGSHAPPPPVDFRANMVIVVHLGTRSGNGHHVGITRITTHRGRLSVYIDELVPAPHCPTASGVSRPFHVVAIPRTSLPADFVARTLVHQC